MMSACIVAAQLMMLPIALAGRAHADRLGRKPILLIGFAILPVRAVLYTLSDDSRLADRRAIARRHRRRHLRRADAAGHRRSDARHRPLQCGARVRWRRYKASARRSAAWPAGIIVDRFGYTAAFLGAGAAAAVAGVALIVAMPETAPPRSTEVPPCPNSTFS
jgi:hypothetical protein